MHLQCHIGTDTVSLARLGASMTGLDFSGPAVGQARSLAARIGADARFVQADVYYGSDAADRPLHHHLPRRHHQHRIIGCGCHSHVA